MTTEPQELAVVSAPVTPMGLLQIATQQGADVDKLAKLMDLHLRWEADQARKAFVVALNAFKADAPTITKNKDVAHNGKFMYRHATLDNVSGAIGAALAKHGISHRWETEQLEGGMIRVTCMLTHEQGHVERVPLQASPDTSGSKNSIQAVGSTVTYLQRYTLLAATGMAVQDQDDDGAGGKTGMAEKDKADWLAAIEALTDVQATAGLWQRIADTCGKIGDIPAYETLKSAMAKKTKALKDATA